MYKPSSAKKFSEQRKKHPSSKQNAQKSNTQITGQKQIPSTKFKEFKLQIDHQIAKCLDTLDRQGLKYLRQTIRTSHLFASEELNQELPQDRVSSIQKPIPQLIQKSSEASPVKSKMFKPKSSQQIQQQIDEIVDQITQQVLPNVLESNGKAPNQTKTAFTTQIDSAPTINVKHIKTRPIKVEEEGNVVNKQPVVSFKPQKQTNKPFHRKSFRKDQKELQSVSHARIQVPSTVSDDREEQVRSRHKTGTDIKIVPNEMNQGQQLKDENKKELDILVDRIAKLSPRKLHKLNKILEKLQIGAGSIPDEGKKPQQPYMFHRQMVPSSSRVSSARQNKGSAKRTEKASTIQGSFSKGNNARSGSKSKIDIQSQQIDEDIDTEDKIPIQTQQELLADASESEFQYLSECTNQKRQEDDPLKTSFQDTKLTIGNSKLKLFNRKDQPLTQRKQTEKKSLEVTETDGQDIYASSQSDSRKENPFNQSMKKTEVDPKTLQLDQDFNNTQGKMVRIGKKKNHGPTANRVVFRILGNRGHPSMVGLTSIQIFDQKGAQINIHRDNIVSPNNPKIMNLFNQVHKTIDDSNMWTAVLIDNKLDVQVQFQLSNQMKIGGFKIWNYNKSALENTKEADQMLIIINEKQVWSGSLKPGSYNQFEDYQTEIKLIAELEFTKRQDAKMQKQGVLNDRLKIPQHQQLKQFKDSSKEAHWLEKTLVQQKIQELNYKERQFQLQDQNARINTIPIRNLLVQIKHPSQKMLLNPIQAIGQPIRNQDTDGWTQLMKEKTTVKIQRQNTNSPQVNTPAKRPLLINQQKDIFALYNKKEPQKQRQFRQPSAQALREIQRRQESQFEELLSPLKQSKEVRKTPDPSPKLELKVQPIKEKANRQRIDDWDKDLMDNSMFKQPPVKKKTDCNPPKNSSKCKPESFAGKSPQVEQEKCANLSSLIDQLNDMMGDPLANQTQSPFTIPQLPRGKNLDFVVLSNWGDNNFFGLNGIQLFNKNGQIVVPSKVSCDNIILSEEMSNRIFAGSYLTSDQQNQWKGKKGGKNVIQVELDNNIELSLIRIWNYNGHRVNSNKGIKLCVIRLNGQTIFQGQIKKASSCAEDTHKFCEYILFTANPTIIKKITEKDWLSNIRRKQQEERKMFHDTMSNFERPTTKNQKDQTTSKSTVHKKENLTGIKLPKRMCNQYDPPLFPEGYTVKLTLYSTWGDQHFIGLNGIQIFNEDGQNILTQKHKFSINAFPRSVNALPGYQKDQRVVTNLVNCENESSLDKNIWLAPYQSDIDRIQKNQPNYIIIEFQKPCKLSAINLHNYSKSPQRGVRQIEVHVDFTLVYRGYVRIFDQANLTHTTLNFTKDPTILEQVRYSGYHEDNFQQQVGLINEQKVIRKVGTQLNSMTDQRPLTGQLSK